MLPCGRQLLTYFLFCFFFAAKIAFVLFLSLLMALGISVTPFLHAWHCSVFIFVSLIHIQPHLFAKLLPFQKKKIQWNYITCLCNSFHSLVPLCSLHFQPLQSLCQNSCLLTSASSFHSPWSPCSCWSLFVFPLLFYPVSGFICFHLNLLSEVEKKERKKGRIHMHVFSQSW